MAMSPEADLRLGRETHELWEQKAAGWDEQIGEGNRFQRVLLAPAVERLLDLRPDQTVLDVACGNGWLARRLAGLGARVVACDFSPTFLARARDRTAADTGLIEYVLADTTNEAQMLALGERRFDAAVCIMGLHDMVTIEPLLRALARLLRPRGRFVFSVPHPAFNFPVGSRLALDQVENQDGAVTDVYHVKVFNYLQMPPVKESAIAGAPPHYHFHRPLSVLLGAGFAAGFVLDGLEEPAFGPDDRPSRPFSWANFKTIPPALVARLRLSEPT